MEYKGITNKIPIDKMKIVSPVKLALIFSASPYFLLSIVGTFFGENLWTDKIIVLSSVFLGFIAGGTSSFKIKLLELHQKIEKVAIDKNELTKWNASLEENLNKTLPLKAGLIIGVLLIIPHYLFYGEYFSQNYGLPLYVLNAVLLSIPSYTLLVYVIWIMLLEYFWIYGLNPKDRPVKLGKMPPQILKGLIFTQGFTRPTIKVGRRERSISDSTFQPIASLALYGSILVGIGGAIALPVVLMGTESRVLALLLVVGIVIAVVIAFIHPFKKIRDVLVLEKKVKLDKINAVFERKIEDLEEMIFSSSAEGKLKKSDLDDVENLTLYIDALNMLDQTHSKDETLPIDLAMVGKLLVSILAPIVSFFVNELDLLSIVYHLIT